MNRLTLDLWVGFFVAIGLASLVFLALKVANLGGANTGETYRLEAKFDNIGSLKIRAPVKCAGVVVGRVSEIRFDSDNYVALVDMKIDSRYKFPRATFSSILTSGLLGEQYIGFDVGGDAEVLKNGDVIKKTQSAVVIEKLISEFMFNKAAEAGDKQP